MTPTTQDIIIGRGYGLAIRTVSSLLSTDWRVYSSGLDAVVRYSGEELETGKLSPQTMLLYAVASYGLEPEGELRIGQKVLLPDRESGLRPANDPFKEFHPEVYRASFYAELFDNTSLIGNIRAKLLDKKLSDQHKAGHLLRGLENYLENIVSEAIAFDRVLA